MKITYKKNGTLKEINKFPTVNRDRMAATLGILWRNGFGSQNGFCLEPYWNTLHNTGTVEAYGKTYELISFEEDSADIIEWVNYHKKQDKRKPRYYSPLRDENNFNILLT